MPYLSRILPNQRVVNSRHDVTHVDFRTYTLLCANGANVRPHLPKTRNSVQFDDLHEAKTQTIRCSLGRQSVLIDSFPANRRVLIVDDEHAVHDRLHQILGPAASSDLSSSSGQLPSLRKAILPEVSFDLTSAYQGQEGLLAVTEAKHSGNPYAIAFVDNSMPPGWDGV